MLIILANLDDDLICNKKFVLYGIINYILDIFGINNNILAILSFVTVLYLSIY